jgi:outer membrane protein OmpA-like peptidoglycan-associated protein
VNMGYPINTSKHDFSLIVSADGTKGYYATLVNKERFTDLFYFELYPEARPIPVSYVKGTVWDSETLQKLGAKVELTDLSNGESVVNSYSDPLNGEFMFALQGNRDYALNVSRDGYLFYSENFSLKNSTVTNPYQLKVPLKKIQIGAGVVLKNIFFETASYELKPESQTELKKLLNLMNQNPGVKIEVGGHTDNVGDKKYNQKLSENRAGAVVNYLIKEGIAKDRITFKGYGDAQPATTNDTSEGRALNRRTEFKIVGI